MGTVRVFVTTLICLALLSPVLWASGFESLGLGTKAIGMGGAFRAVADDWTAACYNPAGYASLFDNELGANLALVHFRNEITPDYRWGGQWESGISNDRAAYNRHEILSNPAAGFAIRVPFWGETVIGLSAYQPFDYNIHWQLFEGIRAYNDSLSLPANQYQNNCDVVSFQLTAAREFIEDKLSIGVGLQVLRGDLLYTQVIFRDNPYLQRDLDWQSIVGRPYDKIVQWAGNDGYGWGGGFTTGILWKNDERLTLAATIDYPFDITINGTSTLKFYMPELHYIPSRFPEGTVTHLLASGLTIVDSVDFEAKLKLPPSVGIGLAYEVNEKLRVSFDAEYVFWSRFDGFNFKYSKHNIYCLSSYKDSLHADKDVMNFLTTDLATPADWSNAAKVMVGGSYAYADYLTLLGGISVDQSPAREDKLFNPLIVDLGTKLGLSTGFIVHLDQWDLGLATSYTHHPDGDVSTLTDIDGDGNIDSFAGLYKADTYQTVLSFNYRF